MFWGDLSPGGREILRHTGAARTIEAGSTIFTEGEPSDYVVVLLSGVVKLTKTTSDGRRILVELRRSGDIIGEVAAIDGQRRSASVSTITTVRALVIPASRFGDIVTARPELAAGIMKVMAAKIREAADRRIEAATNTAISRVASRLVELAGSTPAEDDGTVVLTTLTQQELANWIGLSRERVAQALRDLRTLGWIDTSRRSVTVLDLPALEEAARAAR